MTNTKNITVLMDDQLEALLQEIKPIADGLPNPEQAIQEAKALSRAILVEQTDRIAQQQHRIVAELGPQFVGTDKQEQDLLAAQAELTRLRAAIGKIDAGIYADNRHTVTLIFSSDNMIALEVRGAANRESACATAYAKFNCRVVDGNQTNDNHVLFYLWYSRSAREGALA